MTVTVEELEAEIKEMDRRRAVIETVLDAGCGDAALETEYSVLTERRICAARLITLTRGFRK